MPISGNEAEIGLYYYVARFYDPELGRFRDLCAPERFLREGISADTIVPEPGSVKAYDRFAYVNGNPINYTDPSGHKPCDDFYTRGCNVVVNPKTAGSTSELVTNSNTPSPESTPSDIQTTVFALSSIKTINETSLEAADGINTISGPTYSGTILDYVVLAIEGFSWLNKQPGFVNVVGNSPSVISAVYTEPNITGIGINDRYGVDLKKIVVMNTHFETINFTRITYNVYVTNSKISSFQTFDRIFQPIEPGSTLEIMYNPAIYIPSKPTQYTLLVQIDYWTTNYYGSTTHQIIP